MDDRKHLHEHTCGIHLRCVALAAAIVLAPGPAYSVESYLVWPPPPATQSADIFSYPPDHYGVQVMAAQDKQTILDFLNTHSLGDPPYGRAYIKGEVWYVLLLGVYPSKPDAEAAVKAIPAGLLPGKPWIRQIGPLQDLIRQVPVP